MAENYDHADGILAKQFGASPANIPSEYSHADAALSKQFAPASNKNALTDTVHDIGIGAMRLPGVATGLADIPAGLLGYNHPFSKAADKLGAYTGFQPGRMADQAEQRVYSPERQQQNENVAKAWNDYESDKTGLGSAIGTTLANPRMIGGTIAQSLPQMAAGGVLGRGLSAATKIPGALAGPIGEGVAQAGQAMEQTPDLIDPRQAALGATAQGGLTATVGGLSGKLANRLGVRDINTEMAGGSVPANSALPWYKAVPTGMAQEGGEELAQSIGQQGVQNYTEDKSISQGMGQQAVVGALAGMGMGGAAQIRPSGPLGSALNAGRIESQTVESIPSLRPEPEQRPDIEQEQHARDIQDYVEAHNAGLIHPDDGYAQEFYNQHKAEIDHDIGQQANERNSQAESDRVNAELNPIAPGASGIDNQGSEFDELQNRENAREDTGAGGVNDGQSTARQTPRSQDEESLRQQSSPKDQTSINPEYPAEQSNTLPEARIDGNQQNDGRFLSSSELHLSELNKDADEVGLTPEQRSKIFRPYHMDNVTGFHPATDKVPTVKRAMDYSNQTGKQAHFVEADISNLGGLNSHFKDNHELSNPVFQKISAIFADEMQNAGDHASLIRHGGDELSAVVIGGSNESIKKAMDAAHERVNQYAKESGLDQIPHPKHNPASGIIKQPGVGLYLGQSEIVPGSTLHDIFDKSSKELNNGKIGAEHVGRKEIGENGFVSLGEQAGRTESGTGKINSRIGREIPGTEAKKPEAGQEVNAKPIPVQTEAKYYKTKTKANLAISASKQLATHEAVKTDNGYIIQPKGNQNEKTNVNANERQQEGRAYREEGQQARGTERKEIAGETINQSPDAAKEETKASEGEKTVSQSLQDKRIAAHLSKQRHTTRFGRLTKGDFIENAIADGYIPNAEIDYKQLNKDRQKLSEHDAPAHPRNLLKQEARDLRAKLQREENYQTDYQLQKGDSFFNLDKTEFNYAKNKTSAGPANRPTNNGRNEAEAGSSEGRSEASKTKEEVTQPEAMPKFSRGESTGSTIAEIKSLLPNRVKKLLYAGKVKVVQSHESGVEGFYDPKIDTITLVADNLKPNNLQSVLAHELLHRAEATDPQVKYAIERFESQLNASFRFAQKGVGSIIEIEAAKRVLSANTPVKDQAEEYRAYLVSAYQKNPDGVSGLIKKIFYGLIAAFRMALVRQGVDLGMVKNLTAADLLALSKYGTKVQKAQSRLSENPSNSRAMASAKAERFYSALQRAFHKAPNQVFTNGNQIKGWINGNSSKYDVKKDEIYWSGLNDWLDMQTGKVTREDVDNFLAKNGVQVRDVTLTGSNKFNEKELRQEIEDRIRSEAMQYDFGEGIAYYDLINERKSEILSKIRDTEKEIDSDGEITYNLTYNGKTENFDKGYDDDDIEAAFDLTDEDVFDTISKSEIEEYADEAVKDSAEYISDEIGRAKEEFEYNNDNEDQAKHNTDKLTLPGGTDYKELVVTIPSTEPYNASDSTHFGDVGGGKQVAWIRHNSRIDSEGRSVLFLEEIQSQRGADGRKLGFKSSNGLNKTDSDRLFELNMFLRTASADTVGLDAILKAQEEFDSLKSKRGDKKIPPSPFIADSNNKATNAYISLLLKKAISEAVNEGHSVISWTTGDQQADRYDLSKQVSSVSAIKHTSGNYDLIIHPEKGERPSALNDLTENQLSDYVGKDLAEKITTQQVEKQQSYEGLDLKIGGGWTQAMYGNDQGLNAQGKPSLIHQAAAEIARKMGGEISSIKIKETGKQPALIITPAMYQKVLDEGMPLFSRQSDNIKYSIGSQISNMRTQGSAILDTYLNDAKKDTFIYNLQDRFIDLKRQMEKIVKNGGAITEDMDPRLKEEIYHQGRAYKISQFFKDDVQPILSKLHASGISLDKFQEFLHARHAPSRNKVMAERNPNQAMIDQNLADADADLNALKQSANPKFRDLQNASREVQKWKRAKPFKGSEAARLSLSGMTDKQSQDLINSIAPGDKSIIDELAKKVDKINNGTLDLQVKYGLETQSSVDANKNRWDFYVPLHRDEAHPEAGNYGAPVGKGFSVKGSGMQQATGSNAEVTNILAHIMEAREQMITRGEKNKVTRSLAEMIKAHPDPDFAEVDKYEIENKLKDGIVQPQRESYFTLASKPNVVMYRIDGKDHAIVFNDKSPENVRLAMSLKNLDGQALNAVENILSKGTRWLASVNTQYNLVFGIFNLMRDTQGMALNLTSTELHGKQKQILSNIPKTISAIWGMERGHNVGPAMQSMYERFNHAGGTTGYAQMFDDISDRNKLLQKEIKKHGASKAIKSGRFIFQMLNDFNTMMENSTRLAAFIEGVNLGLSDEKAASIAKNITVNFNRKGARTTEIGALYAFFNASMQGTARMIETLKGPQGKAILSGGVALGAIMTAMSIGMMGADDWEKIPEFLRERSLILPLGSDGKYIAIPMPLGFHIIPNIGRKFVESFIGSNRVTPQHRFADLAGAAANSFNPLGGKSFMEMISPTMVDPAMALYANKDWTGNPIAKVDFNSLNPTPGHSRAKDSATVIGKSLSKSINTLTGGTDYKPGAWSPTPDQIDYVFGQLTGGTGRELMHLQELGAAAVTGEELPVNKIPLVGKIYGEAKGNQAERSAFYDNLRMLNEHKNEIDGLKKEPGGGTKAMDYMRENPVSKLYAEAHVINEQISKIKERRKLLEKAGKPIDQLRSMDDVMLSHMKALNDKVTSAL